MWAVTEGSATRVIRVEACQVVHPYDDASD
jgi:hypothetical protein